MCSFACYFWFLQRIAFHFAMILPFVLLCYIVFIYYFWQGVSKFDMFFIIMKIYLIKKNYFITFFSVKWQAKKYLAWNSIIFFRILRYFIKKSHQSDHIWWTFASLSLELNFFTRKYDNDTLKKIRNFRETITFI